MAREIRVLPKAEYQGFAIPIRYTSTHYYDVEVQRNTSGFQLVLELKAFPTPVTHGPEEYDFPDRLYAEYWEGAIAYGLFQDGTLIGAIETCPEEWSNRLRVTELWVDPAYHGTGAGKMLMDRAKEQLRQGKYRALMLETQSCNVHAIGFYLHQGFTLMGLDTCCYSNHDIQRQEVRLELVFFN